MLALLTGLALAAPVDVIDVGWGFTNVYALVGEHGVVLVDGHYAKHGARVLRRLEKRGVEPGDIRLVVLTHAHPDHAGAASELREATGAPVAIGVGDAGQLAEGSFGEARATGPLGALLRPFVTRDYPGIEADLRVDGTLSLAGYGIAGELRAVGGHTPGSLVVRLDDGRLLSGDLVRGRLLAPRRPARHFLHVDEPAAEANLADQLDGIELIYPGHGGPLPAERVQRWLTRRGG